MARGHQDRREAKRSAKEDRRQERTVSRKEFNALKREVERKTPIDPAQAMSMAAARKAQAGERPDYLTITRGNADYGTPVRQDMKRLQGRSTSGTVSDTARGAGSSLGRRRK